MPRGIFIFCFFTLIWIPQSIASSKDDWLRTNRYRMGLGWTWQEYTENREFQPSLKKQDPFIGPLLWAGYSYWLGKKWIEFSAYGELGGITAEIVSIEAMAKFHYFMDAGMHTSLGFGVEDRVRFQPKANQGFQNVFQVTGYGSIGFRYDQFSFYPKEIGLRARIAQPFFGGDVSFSKSRSYRASIYWQIPYEKPKLNPTSLHEKVIVIEPGYELSQYQFDTVRTVVTDIQAWTVKVGLDF